MPLMAAAVAAIPDDLRRAVRFVMKDGTKPVVIFDFNMQRLRIRKAHC